MRQLFEELFQLYIREEILKHYCARKEWKFSSELIRKVIKVTGFEHLTPQKLKAMFEPFLT